MATKEEIKSKLYIESIYFKVEDNVLITLTVTPMLDEEEEVEYPYGVFAGEQNERVSFNEDGDPVIDEIATENVIADIDGKIHYDVLRDALETKINYKLATTGLCMDCKQAMIDYLAVIMNWYEGRILYFQQNKEFEW